MSAVRSMAPTRSAGGRFGRRLTSRGDVKRAQRAGRSQDRALLRGGRASAAGPFPRRSHPLGGTGPQGRRGHV
jgi:hypothetical protein